MIEIKPGFYYFVHPYSANTKEKRIENYNLCCRRSAKIILKGYNIFSPIVHSHPIEMACPEMLKWSVEERWKFWIALDMAILKYVGFTGVILAPRWDNSIGCRREYAWFLSHQKPDGGPCDILRYDDIISS